MWGDRLDSEVGLMLSLERLYTHCVRACSPWQMPQLRSSLGPPSLQSEPRLDLFRLVHLLLRASSNSGSPSPAERHVRQGSSRACSSTTTA